MLKVLHYKKVLKGDFKIGIAVLTEIKEKNRYISNHKQIRFRQFLSAQVPFCE